MSRFSRAGLDAGRERAGEDCCFAEGRHLDSRRIRDSSTQVRSDRIEQQVAVRADPAAEHDELDVGDGRDRQYVQRDAARLLRDDLTRKRIPGPRGGEDRPRLERGQQ